MSDLVKRLRIKAGMIEMGEMIAWGSDSALMREAADALEMAATAVQGEPVGAEQQPAPDVADYEQVLDDHRRLTRELDVLLNGEEGSAQQASLADLVAQLRTVVRNTGKPVLAAPDVGGLVEALESSRHGLHDSIDGEECWCSQCKFVRLRDAALVAHRKGGQP